MALFCCLAPRLPAQQKQLVADIRPSMKPALSHSKVVNDAFQADLMNANSRYRLGPGDVIGLRFPHAAEFDQVLHIEPDGFVSLAGVGDIRVEGLTTRELTEAVQLAYSKVLQEPDVAVELQDFTGPYFLVLGQVNRPGRYDLRGYTSATEALAFAGGFKDSAQYSRVLLFRRAAHDWYEVKQLNMKQLLHGGDFEEDAEVRPGDMLFVPQNLLSKLKRLVP